ncbi:hypothetical protein TWF730_000931 [Orbilia blumenaviensis]|uniref:Uncharacterized protein n=1 Tax=Orbilia blumenaviensis TaxID=1796055 RepID=A0AAV9VN45_9PEZI
MGFGLGIAVCTQLAPGGGRCQGDTIGNICVRCHFNYNAQGENYETPIRVKATRQVGTRENDPEKSTQHQITGELNESQHDIWPYVKQEGKFTYIDELLEQSKSLKECKVNVFSVTAEKASNWENSKNFRCTNTFLKFLSEQKDENHCFELVEQMTSQGLRALGYYRKIPPRFFDVDPNDPQIHTDPGTKDNIYFSIQFMAKYISDRVVPARPKCLKNFPTFSFKSREPGNSWHTSRTALLVTRRPSGAYYSILYMDPLDTALASSIRASLIGDEDKMPNGKFDHILAVVASVLFSIADLWSMFLREADLYLEEFDVGSTESIPSVDQRLQFTRSLHKLLKLFGEAHSRIHEIHYLSEGLTSHPFIIGEGLQERMGSSLRNVCRILKANLLKVKQLIKNAELLIDLIPKTVGIFDAQAAIEQTKKANVIAFKALQLTTITFCYLPLTLAAGIYGMNVKEITGEKEQHSIKNFLKLGFFLAAPSGVIYLVWSNKDKIGGWIKGQGKRLKRNTTTHGNTVA